MKKRTTQRTKGSTVVPPLAVPFDEALTRLMKVKPPEKKPRKKRTTT